MHDYLTRKEKDLIAKRVSAMLNNQLEAFRLWQEAERGHTEESEEEGSDQASSTNDE